MTIAITPITQADIDGFHRALDIVAREKRYLAFLQAPPLESTRAFVEDNIAHGHPQFVAKTDRDEVVGWCDVTPHRGREIQEHTGTLGMGILPPYRGQGIGRRLMQATLDKAKAQGLTRIELTVRDGNDSAIALYKKMGFEIEGLKRNAARIDGVYEHIYMMALIA